MRLSEDRLRFIARRAARRLIDEGAVEAKVGASNLANLITQSMIEALRQEEAIDEEARARVARQPRLLQGTPEYEAAFREAKRDIAQRKGYPL